MIKYILVPLSFFILLSCTMMEKKTPPKPATPTEAQQLKSAQKLFKKKQYTKAIRRLNKMVKSRPDSELTDDAFILMGDGYYKLRKYEKAYKAYISIKNSNTFSPEETHATYMAAKSLTQLDRHDEALSLCQHLLEKAQLNSIQKLNVLKLKFLLLVKLGDTKDRLRTLAELIEYETNEKNRASFQIKAIDLIESVSDLDELKDLTVNGKLGKVRAYASYKLAQSYFEEKNYSRAQGYFEDVMDYYPESEISERAQSIIQQLNARQIVAPRTIGVVLPLSGRHSSIAHRTLRGLQLGLGIYGKNKSNFKLAVVDSQANQDSARLAVEKLVLEDNVIAIVGSLLSKTATAVAAKSQELGVPNITLSQKSGLTDTGEFIFRSAMTSEMQVQKIVETAMNQKGFKRFAILYPNDKYGTEYANLFWDYVLANGGKITSVQTYEPKEADFSGHIRRLVGTFYIEDRINEYKNNLKQWYKKQKYINSRTTPPSDLLPPILDFDAIFIPDGVKALGQIAPMLAYNDVKSVPLIGTNIWNTPDLIKRGQVYVENSVFVDGLLSSDQKFLNSSFYKEYINTFGQRPSVFEAQAYDIGLLLRQKISEGSRSRISLASSLTQVDNFYGAMGSMQMNIKRELNRPIFSLTVKDGRIEEFVQK